MTTISSISSSASTPSVTPSNADLQTKQAQALALLTRCAEVNSPEALLTVVKSTKWALALLRCAKRKRLLNAEAEVDLQFVAKDITEMGHCTIAGTIRINRDLPFAKKLIIFVFELTNMLQTNEHAKIHYEAWVTKSIKDPNLYATLHEKVEYYGLFLAAKVMRNCIKEDGWHPCLDVFTPELIENWKSFDLYLADMKKSGHFQRLVAQFELFARIQPAPSTIESTPVSHRASRGTKRGSNHLDAPNPKAAKKARA